MRAKNRFLQLGEIIDVALVSVTLGEQLRSEGRLNELHALAVETSEALEGLCQPEALQRAVLTWREAVVAGPVTAEVSQTTWGILEKASFERAANLTPDSSALPPRIAADARREVDPK